MKKNKALCAPCPDTLLLNKIPGMVESIHEAAKEPLEEGTRLEDLEW